MAGGSGTVFISVGLDFSSLNAWSGYVGYLAVTLVETYYRASFGGIGIPPEEVRAILHDLSGFERLRELG